MFAKVLNLRLAFLILLFIQFKTPITWGFSFKDSEAQKNIYLQKVIDQKLWLNPMWLRLGHYEKKYFGYESSFRGFLFIHPEGYISPEKELLETINAFFSESKELTEKFQRHPQCQFLARRHWLAAELHIPAEELLPCAERTAWKKNLNAHSVSLIFAASDLSNPASSFGHTFLKLVNPENAKNKDLIDYGVNYAANADSSEGLFYAFKGLLGFYNGLFTMLPYHQKIREYINIEGRDIWEYPLDFSSTEVNFLVDHLLELERSSAPYYFFSGNCSYHILKTLEVVRPELELSSKFTSFVIPVDTVKVVKRHSTIIKDHIFKKSLKTDYIDSYTHLDQIQKKAVKDTVVKLAIPVSYELNQKEKAEVYETSMKYIAIKAYRTGADLDNEVYALSSERAVLGPVTSDYKIRTTQPPEESHDSSALYFGAGQISALPESLETQTSYYLLKFRPAFHDLEQPDFGAVHMSQSELASLTLRYYPEQKKTTLYKFTFVNLINTNPVTQLDKNISWKIRAELTDPWKPDSEIGGGYSIDYNIAEATRVAYFLTSRYFQNPDLIFLGAGPEILLITRPTEYIGFSASVTYFGVLKDAAFLRIKTKLNLNIKQNLDIQMEAENLISKQTDVQVKILNNFLF